MTRLRKSVHVVIWIFGLLALTLGGLLAHAQWVLGRDYSHVQQPPITADRSPRAVARGEMLFQALCMECHGGADGRATGKHLAEVPSFLGTLYSANLAHPTDGVHARSDGQIARVLRNGVLPSGRLSAVMNGFDALGDDDIAALLGYIRSGAAPFAPGGDAQPPSKVSLAGSLILTYVAKVDVARPARGVPVPSKAPNAEYGRYMARVLDCVGCHTDGFGSDKMNDPNAFAGGFELTDPTGTPIYTKNITFDAKTGIGAWSVDDFEQAVTRGVRPDGVMVRKPMPLFARLDRTDVEALYVYLKSRPPVVRDNKPGGHPIQRARAGAAPEELFVSVGCASCHGETAPFRDKLLGATTKTDAEIAAWILDPQASRPGSTMPSFRGALDPAQAEELGRWVKELAKKRGG